MTWHIPAWYRGPLSKTPYSELNRWRFWPRVLLYCFYGPQVIGLIALAFIPPERVAEWMLWVRDRIGPLSQFNKQMLVVSIFYGMLLGPGAVILAIERHLKKRRLSWLRGRCLNCGETRLSEFLDDCSTCGSQFKEQDQYRAIAQTRQLRRTPAGIRAPVEDLKSFWRSAMFVASTSIVFFLATCIWGHLNESPTKPPRPATSACLVLSSMFVMTSLIMFGIFSNKRTKVNLVRLKGCCLRCEKQLDEAVAVCCHCGASVVAQQLWICRILNQFRGNAGPKFLEFAKSLGIPFRLALGKPSGDKLFG